MGARPAMFINNSPKPAFFRRFYVTIRAYLSVVCDFRVDLLVRPLSVTFDYWIERVRGRQYALFL